MSKMNRLALEELMKRGIDPDQEREEAYIEKHQMQSHLDDLIKKIQDVRMERTVAHIVAHGVVTSEVWDYVRGVEELITALRNYNLVPEQPEPVMLQPENGEDVLF
tara:strand:- start:561 stop:878 length:318 start_codon:yes stop_codon:yes gene_type:complete